jgi:hypothetical protein
MYLRTCGSVKSANHKKIESVNCKSAHLWKVCKSNKLFKSANFLLCDMRNLFADRPPFIANTECCFRHSYIRNFSTCVSQIHVYTA